MTSYISVGAALNQNKVIKSNEVLTVCVGLMFGSKDAPDKILIFSLFVKSLRALSYVNNLCCYRSRLQKFRKSAKCALYHNNRHDGALSRRKLSQTNLSRETITLAGKIHKFYCLT